MGDVEVKIRASQILHFVEASGQFKAQTTQTPNTS
jgi:hypothetical protein